MQVKRGGLFGGSHALYTGRMQTNGQSTQTEQPTQSTEQSNSTPTPVVVEKPKEVTYEMIQQAWTSFALQLPENERALADRMKIIRPQSFEENTFTIAVDNQLAAGLFETEAKRICNGMSSHLNGIMPKMKVVVNKIVVERHVSDKPKQYEILKEKNPLIEKLRQELNLELARG